jgi:hypothetical protein
MAAESVVAAQIVRLLPKISQNSPAVWELIESREPAREGDVVLYDGEGTPIAYARPAR